MNKSNWLYDENGQVRKELYTMSKMELDEKQAELAAKPNPEWCKECILKESKGIQALTSGDIIYVQSKYSIASKFCGRMTFICFHGAGLGLGMFCRTEDGGGGFISVEMLVDKENPCCDYP